MKKFLLTQKLNVDHFVRCNKEVKTAYNAVGILTLKQLTNENNFKQRTLWT